MVVKINPSAISGTIQAPASKSSMQRACAAALLYKGETVIRNPGNSKDDLAALDIIQKLGATIIPKQDELLIQGNALQKGEIDFSGTINCGESGLSVRMFTSIAAISSREIIITGNGSLLQRPVKFFDEIFPALKISIQSTGGLLPLKIKGPLIPVDITIDGSLSSQFLTGLLFAYAHTCTSPVTITVNDLKSKPYIDLTLQVMKHFGWNIENKNYHEFVFQPAGNTTKEKVIVYNVEGDWSNAAFLFVAGAIGGEVKVKGLDLNSSQGDKAILKVLEMAGSKMEIDEKEIAVANNRVQPFEFDATDCPDLFPPLVALAAYCKGITKIKGVGRLTHKESNRAVTLQNEFGKMGVTISWKDDVMFIEGGGVIKGTVVHSNNDHRIAMACAIAALQANGPVEIQHAEAIEKSYPDFYKHLTLLQQRPQKT